MIFIFLPDIKDDTIIQEPNATALHVVSNIIVSDLPVVLCQMTSHFVEVLFKLDGLFVEALETVRPFTEADSDTDESSDDDGSHYGFSVTPV